MSELFRDVMEMGVITHSSSMQNKNVGDNPAFDTKEIINYSYCLQSLGEEEYLFITDPRSKEWVKAELAERLEDNLNPGEAWKIREDVWRPFLVNGKFDYTYSERFSMGDGLGNICDAIFNNPGSRQAILSVWDPYNDPQSLNGRKRVPCSIYYQFFLREGRLHVIYNQRSADAFTHLGNDIWLAFNLMVEITKSFREYPNFFGVKPGYLYHNIGSLHVYRKDWDNIRKSLEELKRG